MSAPAPTVPLGHRFADELPELAIPWQAARVTEPQLLALIEPLAGTVGLDPDWLRGDGRQLLIGNLLPEGARPVAQGLRRAPVPLLLAAAGRRARPAAR